MLPLLEAILSNLFRKRKKAPTQRMEEPMTLNEFDINAAVAQIKEKFSAPNDRLTNAKKTTSISRETK